jgi:hypothetical protein
LLIISSVIMGMVAMRAPARFASFLAWVCDIENAVGAMMTSTIFIIWAMAAGGSSPWRPRGSIFSNIASDLISLAAQNTASPMSSLMVSVMTRTFSPFWTFRQVLTAVRAPARTLVFDSPARL